MKNVTPDTHARSPWASIPAGGEVRIDPPSSPPSGVKVTVPGSKSVSNRVLLLAAMADGESEIGNVLRSDDTYWCLETLKQLGASVDDDGKTVRVRGIGGVWGGSGERLYLGAAGTLARFLPGLLAAAPRGSWRIQGSRSLSERPHDPLLAALRSQGADICCEREEGRLPLRLEARGLSGGSLTASGAGSSQAISGILLAAPYAREATELIVTDGIVQHNYVRITLEWMLRFGAQLQYSTGLERIRVEPGRYRGQRVRVEADASTACYSMAYAALTGGSVVVTNLNPQTLQPDIGFLDVLERMGCSVRNRGGGIEVSGPERLRGGFRISMREMSDQALTLAALAPFADAPIAITGAAHIRLHECDRISAMTQSLRSLSIEVEEQDDGWTIRPGRPLPPDIALPTYDDHRMAMSLALIGVRAPGLRLADPGSVSKTYPAFFDELRAWGARVDKHLK